MGHSHPTLSLKGEGYFDSASMKISLRPQGVFAGACFSHLTFLLVAGRYPGRRCRKVHLRLIVGKRRMNPLAQPSEKAGRVIAQLGHTKSFFHSGVDRQAKLRLLLGMDDAGSSNPIHRVQDRLTIKLCRVACVHATVLPP